MRQYTVEQVSNALSVNQETVRRWIRSGRLVAICVSKKEGHKIGESDLDDFLTNNPKYKRKYCSMEYDDLTNTYLAVRMQLQAELVRLTNDKYAIEKRIAEIQELLK